MDAIKKIAENKIREAIERGNLITSQMLKLNTMRKRPLNIEDFPEYEKGIIEKLT